MKTSNFLISFFISATLLGLAGCTPPPTVRSVAGVSIPKLETNRFTAVWIAADKGIIATRIKDPAAGVVEVAKLSATPDNISLMKFDAILRDSPAGLIWNVSEQAFIEPEDKSKTVASTNLMFGRVVVTDEHLVIHLPDAEVIKDLAARGLIKISFAKNEKGEDSGAPILEALGPAAFDKLATNSVNARLLFEQDPDFVFIRLDK